jgi:hypothetical protein
MNGRTTMISDLPDIDDLDGYARMGNGGNYVGGGYPNTKVQGMTERSGFGQQLGKNMRNDHMSPHSGMRSGGMGNDGTNYPTETVQVEIPDVPVVPLHLQIPCIEIAKHIQDCPICSQFYRCDKTLYIVVIVILVVVCLLLLKKILNV